MFFNTKRTRATTLVRLMTGDPISILPSLIICAIAVRNAPIIDVTAHNVNGAGKCTMVAACSNCNKFKFKMRPFLMD